MTWLAEWIGKHIGSWLGATEPEPLGSMRATLRGSGSVGGKLVSELTAQPVGHSNKHKKAIQREDDEILLLVSVYYGIASNN